MSILEEVEALIRMAKGRATEAQLVKKLEELQAHVAALEAELARLQPVGARCRYCGRHALFLTDSRKSATPFGSLGAVLATYTCRECGKSMEFDDMPNRLP